MPGSKKDNLSHHKARLKDHLWYMITEHQPECVLCGELFKRGDILPSRGVDLLTIHHGDHNHYNDSLGNRCLAHRECHKRHHTGNNIHFWRQFR